MLSLYVITIFFLAHESSIPSYDILFMIITLYVMLLTFFLIISVNAEVFILLPYVFRHASSPTVLELLKPFKYQNVQLFKDM